jgi:hypothetical protein
VRRRHGAWELPRTRPEGRVHRKHPNGSSWSRVRFAHARSWRAPDGSCTGVATREQPPHFHPSTTRIHPLSSRDVRRPESRHTPLDVGERNVAAGPPRGMTSGNARGSCLGAKKPGRSTSLTDSRRSWVLPPPTPVELDGVRRLSALHDPGLTPWISAANVPGKRSTSRGSDRSPCDCP